MKTGRHGDTSPGGPRLRLVSRSVLRVDQALGLILDVHRNLGECLGVFPAVVSAEKKLARVREQDADVRLRAAAITKI